MAKYETSKIDNKDYCVSNGYFTRHLKSHGLTFRDYLEQYVLGKKQLCLFCNSPKSFNSKQKTFASTCGGKECVGLAISKSKQKRTTEQWAEQRKKFQRTQSDKNQIQLNQEYAQRTQSLQQTIQLVGDQIVSKRKQTCVKRYNNSTYNNSPQISESLAERSIQDIRTSNRLRRQTLYARYGKLSLNEFHTPEMFKLRRQKLVDAGLVTPLTLLNEWELFKREVRNTTERVFRQHKQTLDPNKLRGKDYELDHIIPVFVGFIKGMSVGDLVDVRNLRIIETFHNRSRARILDDCEFELLIREVFDE